MGLGLTCEFDFGGLGCGRIMIYIWIWIENWMRIRGLGGGLGHRGLALELSDGRPCAVGEGARIVLDSS